MKFELGAKKMNKKHKLYIIFCSIILLFLLTGCVDITADYDLKYNNVGQLTYVITGENIFLQGLYNSIVEQQIDLQSIHLNNNTLVVTKQISEETYRMKQYFELWKFFKKTYVTEVLVERPSDFGYSLPIKVIISVPGQIQELTTYPYSNLNQYINRNSKEYIELHKKCEIIDNKVVCALLADEEHLIFGILSSCRLC